MLLSLHPTQPLPDELGILPEIQKGMNQNPSGFYDVIKPVAIPRR